MMSNTATRGTSTTVEVPAVGGDVEVRRIPPKLLREVHAKASKGGGLDFQELMVWKLVFGLKDPNFTEAEARRVTLRFTLKTLQPIVDRIDDLSGTDEHLRGVDDSVPHRLRWYAEQMVMATAWLKRFPDAPSRVQRTARARGAGRPAGRRSTTPSRDGPGDDSDPPEPPQAGRLCICGCGRDISHKRADAIYFDSEACRKRHKRALDRAHPDRVVARKLKRLAIADGLEQLTAADLPAGCRCPGEGADRDPEGVWVCVSCGRPLTVGVRKVNGYDAELAKVRGWMRNERVEPRQVHRRHRPGGWRTRPTRKLSAQLRKTRNPETVAATKRRRAA